MQQPDSKPSRLAKRARMFVIGGGRTGALLIHGLAGSIDDLQPLAQGLAERGLTVVGLRLAGHGTTVDDLHASRRSDWIASIRQGLGQFGPEVDRIYLIGESMGAMLAILSRQVDPRVTGLVLLAAPFRIRQMRRRRMLSRLSPPGARWKKPWIRDAAMAAAYQAKGSLLAVTARAYREFLGVVDSARRELSRLNMPTLYIYASNDPTTDPRSVGIIKSTQVSGASFLEIRDNTHHLMRGRNATTIIERVADFIGSIG